MTSIGSSLRSFAIINGFIAMRLTNSVRLTLLNLLGDITNVSLVIPFVIESVKLLTREVAANLFNVLFEAFV